MKRFKWIVEFEVDPIWIEDGFNLTNERAEQMIQDAIPFAHYWEVKAKVKKGPSIEELNAINKWKPHQA